MPTSAKRDSKKILIIQTAFLGDVVLATSLLETLAVAFPEAHIDFLVRKGNEELLENHPSVKGILIWIKKRDKVFNLLKTCQLIRKNQYDLVICLQRFFSGGLLAVSSGAREIRGFEQNPFSRFFSRAVPHSVGNGLHEVERNYQLIQDLIEVPVQMPRLVPGTTSLEKLKAIGLSKPYFVLAPSSVWFTKMWPKEKWAQLIKELPDTHQIHLIGSLADKSLANEIITAAGRGTNLCGKLSLLDSASLISQAEMTFTNDSGPMHLASAMDAPVTAIFCSTIPEFGFGPLSRVRHVIEENVGLKCRPCGLHGHRACPEGHFLCAKTISPAQVAQVVRQPVSIN